MATSAEVQAHVLRKVARSCVAEANRLDPEHQVEVIEADPMSPRVEKLQRLMSEAAALQSQVGDLRAQVERLTVEVGRGAQRVADRDQLIATLQASPAAAEDPDDAAVWAELDRVLPDDGGEVVVEPISVDEGEPPQPVVEGEPA